MQHQTPFAAETVESPAFPAHDSLRKKSEALEQWAQAWAEYFRLDETRDDREVQRLCDRLRALAVSLKNSRSNCSPKLWLKKPALNFSAGFWFW